MILCTGIKDDKRGGWANNASASLGPDGIVGTAKQS